MKFKRYLAIILSVVIIMAGFITANASISTSTTKTQRFITNSADKYDLDLEKATTVEIYNRSFDKYNYYLVGSGKVYND